MEETEIAQVLVISKPNDDEDEYTRMLEQCCHFLMGAHGGGGCGNGGNGGDGGGGGGGGGGRKVGIEINTDGSPIMFMKNCNWILCFPGGVEDANRAMGFMYGYCSSAELPFEAAYQHCRVSKKRKATY